MKNCRAPQKNPALVKPGFEEKFPPRVLSSVPFGNIPQRFPALQGTAGHYIMPKLQRIPAPDASLLLLFPFPPSLRWRLADAMPNKNLKIQKYSAALKSSDKTLLRGGGNAMARAAGCAPQETSAAFPAGRHGQPHATYKGFPALTVTGSWMEKWLGRRLPSCSSRIGPSKEALA